MTGGWTFPDGTRCQTSRNLFQHPSASSTFCLSGQCQVNIFVSVYCFAGLNYVTLFGHDPKEHSEMFE